MYKSSLNHNKGNRATFKDFFGCSVIIVFEVCRGFPFPPFDLPPPNLEGHIWLISSSFSTILLSVGAQIVGLQFLFGHEIQRSTLQKFVDLWDTKVFGDRPGYPTTVTRKNSKFFFSNFLFTLLIFSYHVQSQKWREEYSESAQ